MDDRAGSLDGEEPSDHDAVVVPSHVCRERGHPLVAVRASSDQQVVMCTVCTLVHRYGGDAAVDASRRDPAQEVSWLTTGRPAT